MTDVFSIFDAWEPLLKARKAKGLSKWERLSALSEKLAGKDIKAISFTCSHPSHSGEAVKHLLGSVEGNLHFLLGYGNPKFHLAPYHFQIIDPNTTEEEAEEAFSRIKNPANPVLWAKANITIGDEGDLEEGAPHVAEVATKKTAAKEEKRNSEAIKVKSPTGNYMAYPSEGIIVGEHNNHTYRWDLIKDSFFSAQNPKLNETMNSEAVKKGLNTIAFKESVPETLLRYADQFRGNLFETDVWPLIKSRLPCPGSVLKLETNTAETIYGIITPSKLEFYSRNSQPCEITIFDRVYKSFDLNTLGNVPPGSLLSFLLSHFKVNQALLNEVAKSETKYVSTSNVVEGEPTVGFDQVPAEYVGELNKSLTCSEGMTRLVINT